MGTLHLYTLYFTPYLAMTVSFLLGSSIEDEDVSSNEFKLLGLQFKLLLQLDAVEGDKESVSTV